MAQKVSLRKGNNKKEGQKYKNKTKFRHNKNSKTTKKIQSLPIQGLCQRCTSIVQWRKEYRKYKPLTTPKKCVKCLQKSITDSYHVICKNCAHDLKICSKCMEAKEIVTLKPELTYEAWKEEFIKRLKGLSERSRRSWIRKLDKFGVEEMMKMPLDILDQEESDFSDFDMSDSEQSDDEEEEEDKDEEDISEEEKEESEAEDVEKNEIISLMKENSISDK